MGLCWSAGTSRSSTQKKSRKNGLNPYATRGLDKFSALLADLEEKKQKIYEQSGASEDRSFVRFVYNNSNDLVPIIVKLKDTKKDGEKTNKTTTSRTATNQELLVKEKHSRQISDKFSLAVNKVKKVKKSEKTLKITNNNLLQPWNMVKFVVIMILIFLVFFGRSIAILCTSIAWYVVPSLNGSSTRKNSALNKKDYVKKLSQQKVVINKKSHRQQGHRRSWCD